MPGDENQVRRGEGGEKVPNVVDDGVARGDLSDAADGALGVGADADPGDVVAVVVKVNESCLDGSAFCLKTASQLAGWIFERVRGVEVEMAACTTVGGALAGGPVGPDEVRGGREDVEAVDGSLFPDGCRVGSFG